MYLQLSGTGSRSSRIEHTPRLLGSNSVDYFPENAGSANICRSIDLAGSFQISQSVCPLYTGVLITEKHPSNVRNDQTQPSQASNIFLLVALHNHSQDAFRFHEVTIHRGPGDEGGESSTPRHTYTITAGQNTAPRLTTSCRRRRLLAGGCSISSAWRIAPPSRICAAAGLRRPRLQAWGWHPPGGTETHPRRTRPRCAPQH